jgi:hypothetical protein
MEYWWNDTGKGKLNWLEKYLSQYQFVHHKFHLDWPALNLGVHGERLVTNLLSHVPAQ